ncbi:hypothetical protein F4827_007143 [Paraburkholderia bannensis]|uniref:Uncharacterized protein n=1 Tax=Paraburkholderia bannensis TaxID=765414 RepID=A0A7W9U763_9BURK|nr:MULTISPECIES: hypothetical protein [Paraburkholderia]MBB3262398.1 hypothetical protein [Paraburkholderia sp. WP4_3_2]MBB6107260.1 hypothetical protein [Paraburkholderia bannensis]
MLEDLEWLRSEWWYESPDELSSGDLRRGSVSLHLLLVQGLLGKAWREYGFPKEPKIIAPDMGAIAAEEGVSLDMAAACVAGGGRQRNLLLSFFGVFRVDNPTTGARADAEEGFAVKTTCLAASSPTTNLSELPPIDGLARRELSISQYTSAVGAIRISTRFTRQQVLEYFRNYAGGAHYESSDPSPNRIPSMDYLRLAELDDHIKADVRGGLSFELLSIGQAVATAPDVQRLIDAMKAVQIEA